MGVTWGGQGGPDLPEGVQTLRAALKAGSATVTRAGLEPAH